MAIIDNDLLIWAVEKDGFYEEDDIIKCIDVNDYSSTYFKSGKSKLKFIFSNGLCEYNNIEIGRIKIEGTNCNNWLIPSEVKIKEFPFLITDNLSIFLVYHGEIELKHSIEDFFIHDVIGSLAPVSGKNWVGMMKMIELGKICKTEFWAFSDEKDFNKNNLKHYEPTENDFSYGEILSFS